jgi:hypothetical protein
MPIVWLISARNAVQLFAVKNAITKAIIGDATITGKLIDVDTGSDVGSSSFSIPVVNAGTGHYGGESTELALTHGKEYDLEILGTKSGQTIRRDRIRVVAGYGNGN